MSKAPKFSAELHKLCGKLRDGGITQVEAQRLSEMLRDNRGARRFYRTFMALASALETRTSLQVSVDHENDSDKNIEVLFDLLHMEQEAEVLELPVEPFVPNAMPHRSREHSLGWHEFADASGYLLKQAAKSTPAKWLAAAAVIVLGILLSLQFIGPTAQPPNPIVDNTTTEPGRVAKVPSHKTPAVATITATHNAQWTSAGGASAPPANRSVGSKLHPNTRLTLTAGFAEITTEEGAVVILEAPAIIEMLDNNNAIHLHAGKLVGICETESSKGFVVRTPHLDITDLGTRFVVDSQPTGHTDVFVSSGEVEVVHPAASSTHNGTSESSTPQRLTTGQALRANSAGTVAMLDPGEHALALIPAARLSGMTDYETTVTRLAPAAWWRQDATNPQARVLGDVDFQQPAQGGLGAIVLDGQGALDAGDVLDFEADEPFTMSCWIRPEDTTHGFIAGRMNYNPQRQIHGYDLYLHKGDLYFELAHSFRGAQGATAIRIQAVLRPEIARWTHVTAVYDGSRRASGVRLYIDGRPVQTQVRHDSLGDHTIQADTPFRIGIRGFVHPEEQQNAIDLPSWVQAGSPFRGELGELMVFDRALAGDEVALVYAGSTDAYSATTKPAQLP